VGALFAAGGAEAVCGKEGGAPIPGIGGLAIAPAGGPLLGLLAIYNYIFNIQENNIVNTK
jgi:hypothetical protein